MIHFFASVALLLSMFVSPVFAQDAKLGKDLREYAAVGDTDKIMQLLNRGVDVNTANRFGKSALMVATEEGNMETVVLLLSRGADVNGRTVAGCTALTFAAENGYDAISAMLLERGASDPRLEVVR